MTSSNDISRAQAPRRSPGQSSPRQRQHSLTSADSFSLTGPSDPPDPDSHAYRKDLADAALAGRVIASHYVEPVARRLLEPAELRSAPTTDSPVIARLEAGTEFELLDDALGWAWGYAGRERRVGYVESVRVAARDRA